jgi:hypothetical protein
MVEKKEIIIEIKSPEIILLLVILASFLFFELNVSLNSPIAFGDEGTHVRVAQYFAQEKEYPIWLPFFGTAEEKQGCCGLSQWYLTQGGFYLLLGFNDGVVKFLTPFIASFLSGLAVFILGKKIYKKEVGFVASLIFVSVPSMVTYSVLMYKDSLFVFYFSLFVLTHILAIKTNEKKYWVTSGIFAMFSFLSKTPGLVVFPFILLTFIYNVYIKKSIIKPIKEYFPIILFFILIVGPFFLREWIYFHTPSCSLPYFDNSGCTIRSEYKNQYEYEGRTLEVGTEISFLRMGIVNYLDFAYGIIWFVPIVFLCGLFTLTKKIRTDHILFTLLFISFIPVFYITHAGRAEDFARYTLALLPPIALISGCYFKELYQFVKKYLKWAALLVFIPVIVLSFMNLNGKLYVARHYDEGAGRYVGYKMFSPLFFDACDWVKKNLDEDARLGHVVWASATVYNCQRSVGGGGGDVSLSNNVTLALSVLKMQGVTHIFVQKFSIDWADRKLTERYPISFVEFLENNPDQFKKIYENGPPLQQCRQMGGCDGAAIYEVNYSAI